jgi:hypothetical protein
MLSLTAPTEANYMGKAAAKEHEFTFDKVCVCVCAFLRVLACVCAHVCVLVCLFASERGQLHVCGIRVDKMPPSLPFMLATARIDALIADWTGLRPG